MRLYLTSVGCRLNQAEMDDLAQRAQAAGLTLVRSPQDCDLAVVNSCSVTAAAASDSRSAAARIHRRQPAADILLTGCWATLERSHAACLPGVHAVVPNEAKDRILSGLIARRHHAMASPADFAPPARRTRPVIKVQDGCDHHCTYCVAVRARGAARSLPLQTVVEQVQRAEAHGALEVILTGLQLGAYGRGLPGRISLADLLETLLRETALPRFRLSSLEPWSVDDRLLEMWRDARLCRQLHLPLQSGAAATLRRMGRPMTPGAYEGLARRARQAIPGLALMTDLLVAFPGETPAEFDTSMAFVERMAFARVHVFTYSLRPNTAAAGLSDRVPAAIARQRVAFALQLAARGERTFADAHIGSVRQVLWETPRWFPGEGWRLRGLTDDGLRVVTTSRSPLHNILSPVRLRSLRPDGALQAQILDDLPPPFACAAAPPGRG